MYRYCRKFETLSQKGRKITGLNDIDDGFSYEILFFYKSFYKRMSTFA